MDADSPLAVGIDAVLPQTQCRQCGFAGCRPYAEAIAAGEADINQCAPGGAPGIHRLANLLRRDFKPLDARYGEEKPRAVALIDEAVCIGCTLCIQACPVDAIIGAAKQMHTVVAAWCTGCELCLPPCPVDCIAVLPISESGESWQSRAARTRRRYEFHLLRVARAQRQKADRLARALAEKSPRDGAAAAGASAPVAADVRPALIAAAIARARQLNAGS